MQQKQKRKHHFGLWKLASTALICAIGSVGAVSPMASLASNAGNPVKGSAGWYLVKTSTGFIGLVKQATSGVFDNIPAQYGQVVSAKVLSNDPTLAEDDLSKPAIAAAGRSLGATVDELIDLANAATRPYIFSNPNAGGSSALPNPNFTSPSKASAIGGPAGSAVNAVSGLAGTFDFLGNLSFWKGLGLVIGGAAILIFAAVELIRK